MVYVWSGDITEFHACEFGLEPLAWPGHRRWTPRHAYVLATRALQSLPQRMAHSLLAGVQAQRVRATVSAADGDLLVSAALLHDIGYSPALVKRGFHPIDGANFLVDLGAPMRLAALVAHHSEVRFLAAANGLLSELSKFPREEGPVADALAYADMTAGPDGAPMTVQDRLDDIAARHAHEDPALLAARLARVPYLLAATERVQLRISLSALA
jgi:hypothetical protein